MKRILFVCLGNICRSPTAESVMNSLIDSRGLHEEIVCDSAATGGWHVGNRADPRMREHLMRRGYESTSRARQVSAPDDFKTFDLILAMDNENLRDLKALDPDHQYHDKIQTMVSYCVTSKETEVPDPYYGGAEGFEKVIDLLEDACEGLLDALQ